MRKKIPLDDVLEREREDLAREREWFGLEYPDSPDDVLHTVDTFIKAIPWGKSRSVLVYHRRHGARSYVRIRTWNLHRTKGVWYPSRRFFVVPFEHAADLGDAMFEARFGVFSEKPAWLIAREEEEERRIDELREFGMHEEAIAQAIIRKARKELGQH